MKKSIKNKTVTAAVFAVFCISLVTLTTTAMASSSAIATGNSTEDGRPVAWKNRDHWSTADGWKVLPFYYSQDGSSFGSDDRYTSRFNYMGVTALGTSGLDVNTGTQIPWAGANDKGLGLVQVAGHTVTSNFTLTHNHPVSQDLASGMTGGYLNHIILSRAERVDEVEQILRDTNDGGGFNSSTARNTSTIISVFDRWGNAATFEIDGDSFVRDNVTQEYQVGAVVHDDDKDATNPIDGEYSGYDWRTNFTKVQWTKPNGFSYFVDSKTTKVDSNGNVVNSGSTPDGIHDLEYSPSAVKRHTRTGIRMDDVHKKDYRYFIYKYVGTGALGKDFDVETLSKNVGELPSSSSEKATGFHLNRYVSTFGTVITGSKIGDPYDGKLITMWVALGEPTVSVFVPLFPYAGEVPTELLTMYLETNTKRHQVYDYTDDNSSGQSSGRNVDHTINLDKLVGGGYYGEGGIHEYTSGIEVWAFNKYDEFIADLRDGTRTDYQLRTDIRAWQTDLATKISQYYADEVSPLDFIDNKHAEGTGWSTSRSRSGYYSTNYDWKYSSVDPLVWKTWKPKIGISGNYKVSYWLPDGSSNRGLAWYNVRSHSDGYIFIEDYFSVDQRESGGGWIDVGTYEFVAGGDYHLQVSGFLASPYGNVVIADAAKFELQ